MKLQPPCPSKEVVVELCLSTHFTADRKVTLTGNRVQPAEQDKESLRSRVASVEITSQLQRAVLMAACCLNCEDEATQDRGLNILDLVDDVEQ